MAHDPERTFAVLISSPLSRRSEQRAGPPLGLPRPRPYIGGQHSGRHSVGLDGLCAERGDQAINDANVLIIRTSKRSVLFDLGGYWAQRTLDMVRIDGHFRSSSKTAIAAQRTSLRCSSHTVKVMAAIASLF